MRRIAVFIVIVLIAPSATALAIPTATPIAQWTCESAIDGYVADVSQAGNDLRLGSITTNYSPATLPQIVSGGYSGNALLFDGVDDEAIAIQPWNGYDQVSVDVWINPSDGAGINVIVEASSTWSLSISNNKLGFTTWHSDGSTNSYSWASNITMNTWHHVQAIMTKDGEKQLTLDGTTNTILTSGPALKSQTKSITVGNKSSTARYYNGLIDEIVVTPEPATVAMLSIGFLALRKKRKF